MIHSSALFSMIVVALLSSSAWAQDSELERLSGFALQQKELLQFDAARIKGERAHLEEVEQWENLKERQLEEYKKNKKTVSMSEDGPEAKADAAAKAEFVRQYENAREKYAEDKSKRKSLDRLAHHLPSEAEELDLIEKRPRFDYRKRPMFGAPLKYGKSSSSSGSSGRDFRGSSGGSTFGGGSSFPPPPTFDDFGNDGGYVPAPNMSDDFGDVPPPPPPPPGFGDEYAQPGGFPPGDFDSGMDFPPPPPPPPPPFGTEGEF